MKTVCPLCLRVAPLRQGHVIGRHNDGNKTRCVMTGKKAPPWDQRSTRAAVAGRSGGVCEFCLRHRATEMHHRQSRGVGGAWSPGNILHLCTACHRRATENPQWAYGLGVSVRSTEDYNRKPVLREDLTAFQPTDEVTR